MAEIILGTSNAFALRHWPEPEVWAEIISRDLGLQEVQFSFDLLDPTIPEPGRSAMCHEVREAASRFNLSIHTTFTGFIVYAQHHLAHPNPLMRAHARQWYVSALEVTSSLKAVACGGHIGAMGERDFADPARRNTLRASVVDLVRGLTRVAAALGQHYFLWELMHSPSEFISTPQEAIDTLEAVNVGAAVPVRLCFDLGHCLVGSPDDPPDPYRWLGRLLPWSPVIHLQQTDGKHDRHWPFSSEYDAVGIIEPKRVVEIARASPLERVMLLFELAHPFDAPEQGIIDDHKRSVEVWSRWL